MICCFSDIMLRYIKIELVTGDNILKTQIFRFWFRLTFLPMIFFKLNAWICILVYIKKYFNGKIEFKL